MKQSTKPTGKISDHFQGLGTVDQQTVEQRAKEIAIINGRLAEDYNEADWAEAKAELSGARNPVLDEPEDSINGLKRWDEVPGTSGKKISPKRPSDEQTFAEQLVEEGVAEAEHEQMLSGSTTESQQTS